MSTDRQCHSSTSPRRHLPSVRFPPLRCSASRRPHNNSNLPWRSTAIFVLTICLVAACVKLHRFPGSTGSAAEGAFTRADAASLLRSDAAQILRLEIVDEKQRPVAARFSLTVDGESFQPPRLNEHGLRFVSVHESKNQRYPVTYARGTGPVEFELPADAKQLDVSVAKGFEYLPVTRRVPVMAGRVTKLVVEIKRWAEPGSDGWVSADAHLHYDRLSKEDNRDWLTMLDADGLNHGFFMVLKGGKVPGIWARQYAYGPEGEATDRTRLLVAGEEYRDSAMGHINLLGLSEVIQPISTGGLGEPKVHVNWPPLADVLSRTRKLGGFAGVAHGGSLGRHPTATIDSVLGAVDFFEIGNAHLYSLRLWYDLLNCGVSIPPAAGTDLPNYPFRDPWQPFLGSMRMYVKTGGQIDFTAWKRALSQGAVFVTSGPLLKLTVNGEEIGSELHVARPGQEVLVEAELASPVELKQFELIVSGRPVRCEIEKIRSGPVQRWKLRHNLKVHESCWIAVRGRGVPIQSLVDSIQRDAEWVETDVVAHSGITRVLVGRQPIRSAKSARILIQQLQKQRDYYQNNGRYQSGEHRLKMVDLFDQAITALSESNLTR